MPLFDDDDELQNYGTRRPGKGRARNGGGGGGGGGGARGGGGWGGGGGGEEGAEAKGVTMMNGRSRMKGPTNANSSPTR
jgi:hypothetical protein